MCVGKLHEVKGQRYLLDACRILVSQGIALFCHLVGEGPDRSALERLIKQFGFQNSVRNGRRKVLIGHRRHAAAGERACSASVPSRDGRREGIPVVLMEAMSSGVPVVASRIAGIPELVEDGQTGLRVEPGDSAGIARALIRLKENAELARRLASAARIRIEEQFDVDHSAAELIRLFRAAGVYVGG